VPLGSFTTVHSTSGPYRCHATTLSRRRIDGIAARVIAGPGDRDHAELAANVPEGFDYEWTPRFQQLRAGSTSGFAFGLAVVFVFLVLAAQYES